MKSIVKTLLAASLSIAAVSACSEEKLAPSTAGTKTTVHFGAVSSIVDNATKATLTPNDAEDAFEGRWENGDELSVQYLNGKDDEGTVNAQWTGSNFSAVLPEYTGEWMYEAAYPVPDATDSHVDFGSSRTQKGNAYNSKYDIMIGSALAENAEAGKDDEGNNIVFNMDRQTAIAYFHFTSNLDEALKSATLSVTGDNAFVASNYAYVSGFKWAASEDCTFITVTFPEEAPSAKDFQLWFNVLPTEYTSMSLTIETATKTLTINKSTLGSYIAGHLYKVSKEIPEDKWVSSETVYTNLAELNEAILASDSEIDFKLNLAKPAVITRICSDNKTTFLQDETGGVMYYSSTKIQNAVEGMTISGEISGKAKLYNGLPEITSISTANATFGTTTDIPCFNLTIAELNADFNKYLNSMVKFTDVEVSDAFSNSDRNGTIKQGENELAVYVKATDKSFEVSAGSIGNMVLFPAIFNFTRQANFWMPSDFETTLIGGEIVLNSSFTVNVGETVELKATTNSTATIKYVSADEAIATVSAEGIVTGVKEGTVEITASIDAADGFTAAEAKTTVTVKPAGSAIAKVLIIDGAQLNSTATTSESVITVDGVKVTLSKGAKVQKNTKAKNCFSDKGAILIGKSGAYVFNSSAIPGVITKFEIYSNLGASAKVSVGVNFSESPITSYSATNAWTQTLETLDSVYDCSSILSGKDKYFWFQVTNANNSQVQFRITYMPE